MSDLAEPQCFHQRFPSADGLSLFYREFTGEHGGTDGNGRPVPVVLCLAGLTRNGRDFLSIAAHLARRYRVLVPDFRGRGESDRDANWRNYHPGTYVADTLQLLEVAGVRRCAILGTSLGGLVAMLLAREVPDRLTGIILNDVGPEIGAAGLARISQYIGQQPPVASWAEAVVQVREAYAVTLPDYTDADWLAFARKGYREGPDGVPVLDMDPAIGRALREVGGTLPDPWAIFDRMALPTLVLRGATSDILTAETLAKMHAHRPDLESVTIPNRGHVPQLDEPDSIAAIDSFLARLRIRPCAGLSAG